MKKIIKLLKSLFNKKQEVKNDKFGKVEKVSAIPYPKGGTTKRPY
jgi:hypothetical protein